MDHILGVAGRVATSDTQLGVEHDVAVAKLGSRRRGYEIGSDRLFG